MNNVLEFILLVFVGIIVGGIGVLIYNSVKGNSLGKKREEMLEKTRKESEKIKRDSILETKEELHK